VPRGRRREAAWASISGAASKRSAAAWTTIVRSNPAEFLTMRAPVLAALAAAASMQPALAAPGPAAASVSGQVLETAQASGCSCLRLKTASGEVWAAVPAATVAKGRR
jgi:hypothetical protein